MVACIDCLAEKKSYRLDEDGRCCRCAGAWAADELPLAPTPTRHLPGTVGKLETMRWRAERRLAVLHPLDAVEDSRGNLPSSRVRYYYEREPRPPRRLLLKCG
jgi:hypothetical protein